MSTELCEIKPVQAFLSTNLNNKNRTFEQLTQRILRNLGWPVSTVELHQNQIDDAIAIAIEYYTKYAGYEDHYLIFDSRIYERDRGIRMDKICTIASIETADSHNVNRNTFTKNYDQVLSTPKRVYVAKRDITMDELPSNFCKPITNLEVITAEVYDEITMYNPMICSSFEISRDKEFTMNGEEVVNDPDYYVQSFDYDMMDYRRVIEVISFEETSVKSMTSLFSLESALASQAYYTYQFSLRGFDLLSFHSLQEFLGTRKRVLALERSFKFNPRTQYFTLTPQPKDHQRFMGLLHCYIEPPIRDVIDRMWVFKYALAQCKVILGRIRGKHGSVQMAGGGVMADNLNLLAEGKEEMKELEKELMEGTAFSEKRPALFFVG